MNVYIQLLLRFASDFISPTYSYFSYFLSVFTFLFETFPYNVITAIIVALFLIKYFKDQAALKKTDFASMKEQLNKMKSKTKYVRENRLRMASQMPKIKKRLKNVEDKKTRQKILKDLENDEREFYEKVNTLDKQIQQLGKRIQKQQSMLDKQIWLNNQLEKKLYSSINTRTMKGRFSLFLDFFRGRIEFIVFRVYCIFI